MDFEPVIPIAETLDGVIGLQVDMPEDGVVKGRLEVTRSVMQPMGLVHGGVYAVIAESLASMGTMLDVVKEGKTAQGLSNTTNFMRPITSGNVNAEALRIHKGRTTQVWDVTCRDDQGRICAVTRMVVAVRSLQPDS